MWTPSAARSSAARSGPTRAAWVLFACTLPLLLAFHPVTINGFTASRTGVGISRFLAGSAGSAYRSCHRRTCCAARRAAAGEKRFLRRRRKRRRSAKRQAPAYYGAHALRGAGAERLSARALVGFGDTRLLAEERSSRTFDSFKRYMRKPVKPTYDSGGGFATGPPLPKARSTTRMTRRSIARRPRARPLRTTTGMCSAASSGATARSFSGGQGQKGRRLSARHRLHAGGDVAGAAEGKSTSTWCSMASMLLRSSPRWHTISASAKSERQRKRGRRLRFASVFRCERPSARSPQRGRDACRR